MSSGNEGLMHFLLKLAVVWRLRTTPVRRGRVIEFPPVEVECRIARGLVVDVCSEFPLMAVEIVWHGSWDSRKVERLRRLRQLGYRVIVVGKVSARVASLVDEVWDPLVILSQFISAATSELRRRFDLGKYGVESEIKELIRVAGLLEEKLQGMPGFREEEWLKREVVNALLDLRDALIEKARNG